MLDLGQAFRRQALKVFLAPYPEQDVLHDPPSLEEALKSPILGPISDLAALPIV